MEAEKIPVDKFVITDDLNLDFEKLRLRKGSDGGHNGLKDIQEVLKSNIYPRPRIGIGSFQEVGSPTLYLENGQTRRLLRFKKH